jgi:transposase-like protein
MNSREIATQYRMSQWLQVIQERMGSGERIDEYCDRKGIKRHTYFYWQRKLRETAGKHLAEQQKQPENNIPRFTEVRMLKDGPRSTRTEESGQILVEVAGVRIRAGSGYPTDKLTSLLRELSRQC